jgi:hypothetical protein
MQWLRGAGQSHCFSCCGRHVKIVEFDSQATEVEPPLESADGVTKLPPSLNDFIMRITAMDATEPDGAEVNTKTQWAASKSTANNAFLFDTESDDCVDAINHLSEGDNVDWNAQLRGHHLQKVKTTLCSEINYGNFFRTSQMLTLLQRLVLLSSAAEACAIVRASDLPVSAVEPVMQLRVMGNFSISSSEDDAEEDSALRKVSQSVS